MEFIVNNKDYPEIIDMLRCIKCGSKDNLIPYNYTTKSFNRMLLYKRKSKDCSVIVPTCRRCNHQFNRYNVFKSKYSVNLIEIFIVSMLSCVFLFFILKNFNPSPLYIIILGFSLLILAITVIIGSWIKKINILRSMDDNPNKYMHFTDEKILYIKNECSETWIDYEDWINRALQEEFYLTHKEKSCIITGGKIPIKGVLISCDECGAKVDNQKIYCWKCGNLLPLV